LYAIVDIETTGSVATQDRITEIAIFKHDGKKIVDQYSTFVNPERSIPPFISNLTGITNEMVKDAPKFFEVAKDIIEFTTDCVFVAHNVNFDYSFIKKEFNYLSYNYMRKTLCTVRLSRKLLPGHTSYSLGKLSKALDIELPKSLRHRAIGDAKATAEIFTLLMNINEQTDQFDLFESELSTSILPPNIDIDIVANLPQETGVYYFHNKDGDIIYIGKSKNIKNRVTKHFSVDYKSRKAIDFKNNIYSISYELTGSELVALLLESAEIKKYLPKYNKAQRRTVYPFGLYYETNEDGYINFFTERVSRVEDLKPVTSFGNNKTAKNTLHRLAEQYELCQNLTSLGKPEDHCFFYQIKKCKGACMGEEEAEAYNLRAEKILLKYGQALTDIAIIGKGRRFDEASVVFIENGTYKGFGYFDHTEAITNSEDIINYISHYEDNKDVRQIIIGYIRKNKTDKIIKL
jgi:DNA polymerase III subunit epsilon